MAAVPVDRSCTFAMRGSKVAREDDAGVVEEAKIKNGKGVATKVQSERMFRMHAEPLR